MVKTLRMAPFDFPLADRRPPLFFSSFACHLHREMKFYIKLQVFPPPLYTTHFDLHPVSTRHRMVLQSLSLSPPSKLSPWYIYVPIDRYVERLHIYWHFWLTRFLMSFILLYFFSIPPGEIWATKCRKSLAIYVMISSPSRYGCLQVHDDFSSSDVDCI